MNWMISPELVDFGRRGLWRMQRSGELPRALDLKAVERAKIDIADGKLSAYVRVEGGRGEERMICLEPEGNLVKATIVPALHFVSGIQSRGDKLNDFWGILQSGFRCGPETYNAYLLTSAYAEEKKITSIRGRDGLITNGMFSGDSVKVLLWSGFGASYVGSQEHEGRRIGDVWRTPVEYLEGVIMVAGGTDWESRVQAYRQIYQDMSLRASLTICGNNGWEEKIG